MVNLKSKISPYLYGAKQIISQVNSAADRFLDKQQDFADYRRSLGIYTDEEKEAAKLAAIEQTQEELNNLDWNSEDAEGIYRSFASPEDIRTMETAKGIGTTVATLPFTAGAMGWVPALTTTATGVGGGYAGAYGGQKLGQWIDGKYGTNLTPGLTFAGSLVGGTIGGGLGYKGIVKFGSQGWLPKNNAVGNLYSQQFVKDVGVAALDRQLKNTTPAIFSSTLTPHQITMEYPRYKAYDVPLAPQFWKHPIQSKLTREELLGLPKHERRTYAQNLGKSRITPEERMGVPKGDRNNGKYNGIMFFRTLDQVPAINSDGFVDLTSPFNTFLNTTSDNLVHLHSMYPRLKNHAIAIDPEAFRGSTLTTLDPSDHVFIRETVKVKPKHVTLITGDPEAITLAQQRGFNVITNPKLKIYWQNGGDQIGRPDFVKINSKGEKEVFSTLDFKELYDEEVRKIVTNSFSRPKLNIYENLSKQTGLPLKTQSFTGKNFVKPYPGVEWSPSDFKHVVYNPASPAEQYLMTNYGLNVTTDTGFIPLWKTSDSFGDRAQWIRIRKALDQMKQDVKPLKNGGKL